jgi:uncharacterized membrane protein
MKSNSLLIELGIAIALVGVLTLFLMPGELLMPKTEETMITVVLAVLFIVFSALVFREGSKDERENVLRMNAGRISFLIGSIIAVIGILYQSLSHNIDPWLVMTLIGMVLAKALSRLYFTLKN